MKKGMIYLIALWVVLLGGIFVYSKIKNSGIPVDSKHKIETPTNETVSLEKYPYIDYTEYYNENDLKAERIYLEGEHSGSSYVKISGLKNKKLEEKLNNDFYEIVDKFIKNGYNNAYSNIHFNAFNVFSLCVSAYSNSNPDLKNTMICRNIDLTTGNELKISDIINTTNIKAPVAHAFYDSVAYTIQTEINNINMIFGYYDSCISNGGTTCESGLGGKTIDELKQELEKYNSYITDLEDESLKYARNFDLNQAFYINSAGITIEDCSYKDLPYVDAVKIQIFDNPRLFNFYYKYKTDESIFDGSYIGRKNLLYAAYRRYNGVNSPSDEILDYAVIFKDFGLAEDERYLEEPAFKNYLDSLDKSKFYYIHDLSSYEETLHVRECEMTKNVYDNEFRPAIIEKQKKRGSTSIYDIKNDNVSCKSMSLYFSNPNMYTIYEDGITKIYLRNNLEKANEINETIKNLIDEAKKNGSAYMTIKEVTESQITICISKHDKNGSGSEEYKTFDL